MPKFGNRPDDVLQDKQGNIQSGVAIVCYGSEADATAQTNSLGTAVSGADGRWPITISGYEGLWVRDPNGNVWAVASESGVGNKAKRFQVDASEYATPHQAMAAVAAGGRVFFPAGTYALGGTSLTATVDNVHIDALGATFTVNTWGVPAFDLLDVDGWTLDVGLVQYVGARGDHTGTFRGGAPYTAGSGVYTNGDRHYVRNLRTIGMPTPVYFSSWDGASLFGRTGSSNRIGRLECEGYDFGVLWASQRNLVIDDLYAHDDIDDSGGANPTHAYYASGVSTARSTGVTIKKARCENNLGGQAFQLKYADQVTLTQHSANNCKGLINILDCDDLTWDGLTGTALVANGGQGSITFGFGTAVPKRPKLTNTSVQHASGVDERAASIWADDARIDGLSVELNHSGSVNTGLNAIILRGSRGRARNLNVRSIGAAHMRGVAAGFGTDTVTDWVIENPKVLGSRSVVDALAASTGVRVQYDPGAQSLTGASAPVGVSGSATGSELSIVAPRHAYLSTLGTNPGVAAVASGGTVIVPVANSGIQVLVTPDCDIAVSNLLWFSGTASGNYDIAIIDDALSTKLWSKGSTAWPAAGTITETVTGVTMRAGRTYRITFSADNTTGTLRGATAAAGDVLTRVDGLFAAYLTTSLFPVPASPARGTGASTRVPLIIIRGS